MEHYRWYTHFLYATDYDGLDPVEVNWAQNWFKVGPFQRSEISLVKARAIEFLSLPAKSQLELVEELAGYDDSDKSMVVRTLMQLFAALPPEKTVNWQVSKMTRNACSLWVTDVRPDSQSC
ncbi:MAG TPA: hypothetical protein VNI35_05445 [Nitrospira sp.]|nr:hypothetical protein [Nitrospira sp.]